MQSLILTPQIEHIRLLSQQLDSIYRSSKPERKVIAQWEEEQEYSILGTLELFSDSIQGYAEHLITSANVVNPEQILNHLQTLNIFSLNYFTAWYFSQGETYPNTKQYIETLDHLRLLLRENLSTHSTIAA